MIFLASQMRPLFYTRLKIAGFIATPRMNHVKVLFSITSIKCHNSVRTSQ